jgi:excisionase family DNA binding protein
MVVNGEIMQELILVDINELSQRISVPKGTLYNWVYLHRIPFVKAGRSLRFDPDEVIRSMPHYAKSEAVLRGNESRRGA